MSDVLIKRGNLDTNTGTQGERHAKRHRKKTVAYSPRREAWNVSFPQSSGRMGPADILILDFQNGETINFCHLGHLVCGPLLQQP